MCHAIWRRRSWSILSQVIVARPLSDPRTKLKWHSKQRPYWKHPLKCLLQCHSHFIHASVFYKNEVNWCIVRFINQIGSPYYLFVVLTIYKDQQWSNYHIITKCRQSTINISEIWIKLFSYEFHVDLTEWDMQLKRNTCSCWCISSGGSIYNRS